MNDHRRKLISRRLSTSSSKSCECLLPLGPTADLKDNNNNGSSSSGDGGGNTAVIWRNDMCEEEKSYQRREYCHIPSPIWIYDSNNVCVVWMRCCVIPSQNIYFWCSCSSLCIQRVQWPCGYCWRKNTYNFIFTFVWPFFYVPPLLAAKKKCIKRIHTFTVHRFHSLFRSLLSLVCERWRTASSVSDTLRNNETIKIDGDDDDDDDDKRSLAACSSLSLSLTRFASEWLVVTCDGDCVCDCVCVRVVWMDKYMVSIRT